MGVTGIFIASMLALFLKNPKRGQFVEKDLGSKKKTTTSEKKKVAGLGDFTK